MAEVLEPLLPMVCSCSSVTDVLSMSAASRYWCQAARSNQVWIHCSRSKWLFGALFQVSCASQPGERDEASLALWRRSVEEYRAGVSQSDAFGFFLNRCKQDQEVRRRLSDATEMEGEAREHILSQMNQLGPDALDILLHLESADKKLRPVAHELRIHITNSWAQQRWKQLLAEPKPAALEEGALILSQWGYPTADVPQIRLTLERLAQRAQSLGARRQSEGTPTQAEVRLMVVALNQALYEEFGLQGNQRDYYNPENSMLHSVLSKKKGIPISLSVVWAAVARRCGLLCHPLANVPRHVLIRIPATGESTGPAETKDFYLDAFDGGKLMLGLFRMTWQEFSAFLTDMLAMMGARNWLAGMSDIEPHLSEFVAVTPPVLLYLRMMRNLENIYGQTGDQCRLQGIQLQMRTLIRLLEEEAEAGGGYRR